VTRPARRRVVRRDAVFVAAALIATLSALGDPRVSGEPVPPHHSVIIDVSDSAVAVAGADRLPEWAGDVAAGLPGPATVSVVAMAASARLVIAPEPLPELDDAGGREQLRARVTEAVQRAIAAADGRGTRVDLAFETAVARRPAGVDPRAVTVHWLTDGRAGDADLRRLRAAAQRLGTAMRAIPITPGADRQANIAVRRPAVADRAAVGRTLLATAEVIGPPGATIELHATLDDASLAATRIATPGADSVPDGHARRLTLPAGGRAVVSVRIPAATAPGLRRISIEAITPAAADALPGDNRVVLGTIADAPRIVAITPGGEPTLFTRLLAELRPQLQPDLLAPADAPLSADDWIGTTTVIIDGVPRHELGGDPAAAAAADAALARAVRDFGLNLLMAGGPGAFGAGGYIDSAIAPVLPVRCDPNDTVPIVVTAAVDTSASMAEGMKWDRVVTALDRLAGEMQPRDRLIVHAFSDDATGLFVDVTGMSGAARAAALGRALAGVTPAGRTNLAAAFDAVTTPRDEVDGAAQLGLVLTDGEPTAGPETLDAERLGRLRDLAAGGFHLGLVATGSAQSAPFVAELAARSATWPLPGRDRVRVIPVADFAALPAAFLDLLRRARGPLTAPIRAGGYAVADPAGDVIDRGRLRSYARTAPWRPADGVDAQILATAVADDPAAAEPLVAVRQLGSGATTAAIMVPFDAPHQLGDALGTGPGTAVEAGRALARHVPAAVDAATRPRPAVPWRSQSESDGESVTVVLDFPPGREPPAPPRLWRADDPPDAAGLPLPQVAPGRYAASLPALPDAATVTIRAAGAVETLVLAPQQPREWRNLGVDPAGCALLDLPGPAPRGPALRTATGGAPLAPWLAAVAALLVVAVFLPPGGKTPRSADLRGPAAPHRPISRLDSAI
jgi:hypothetical protein